MKKFMSGNSAETKRRGCNSRKNERKRKKKNNFKIKRAPGEGGGGGGGDFSESNSCLWPNFLPDSVITLSLSVPLFILSMKAMLADIKVRSK